MRLKVKLLLALILIGLIPAIIISIITLQSSSQVLIDNKFDQLVSLKQVKQSAVEKYLQLLDAQSQTMSVNPTVIDGIKQFSDTFGSYAEELNVTDGNAAKFEIKDHYNREFITILREADPAATVNSDTLVRGFSINTLALQQQYISQNPNSTGNKHLLNVAPTDSNYDRVHANFHPYFRKYLEDFGYYDVFLINASGDVVYSVFKEIDYATSLVSGPYSGSGLAKAFKGALNLGRDETFFVDFEPYLPSYNAPAGFKAAPVYSDGKVIGVIAFQFPIDRLNQIMTERDGLGETGETYLVGSDFLMRSDSYLDPVNHTVDASFRNPRLGMVKTEATRLASEGKSGIQIVIDYNDNPVLSAFGPLSHRGLEWMILAEIDEAEVMIDVNNLRLVMLGILLVSAVLILGVAYYIARSILRPLGGEPDEMSDMATQIASGDLTVEFEGDQGHGAYHAMHTMAERLRDLVSQITNASFQQSSAAEELSAIASQNSSRLGRHKQSTEQVATAMHEMSASVSEVSESTRSAADASKGARLQVSSSAENMVEVGEEIQSASKNLFDAKEKVEHLKDYAHQIASILESIKGIADQTNLLALNAAIEAARAGEQGRGFAVVADEVRSLAQNTQNSTEEISNMITTLQQGTDEACGVMNTCVDNMNLVSDRALSTASNLDQVVSSTQQVDDMMTQIAGASVQQSSVAEEISQKITELNDMSNQGTDASSQVHIASQELARLSAALQELVGNFKV